MIFFPRGVTWKQPLCDYMTILCPLGTGTTQFSWFLISHQQNRIKQRNRYSFYPAKLSNDRLTMGLKWHAVVASSMR